MTERRAPEKVVGEIKRRAHRKFNSEEKIRIVLEGLRGEEAIALAGATSGARLPAPPPA